jgi:hypothetical protein
MSKPSESYREVLRLLPTLTGAELAQVQSAIKALGAIGPAQDDSASQVLKCLCNLLQKRGLEFPQPSVLMKMSIYPAYKRKVPALLQYLQHAGLATKVQQWAALSIGFGLLYDSLTAQGLACDASVLMRQVHRLPALINREFPGYAEAGYLAKIVLPAPSEKLLAQTD